VDESAGAADPRFLVPAILGAMIAFSTFAEPQIAQVTSLRLTCES